jgi:hypothetical protein
VTVINDHHGLRAAFEFADRGLGTGVEVAQRDIRAEQVHMGRGEQARGPRVLLRSADPRPGQAVVGQRGERHPAGIANHPVRVERLSRALGAARPVLKGHDRHVRMN